jgi:hypothetical protein
MNEIDLLSEINIKLGKLIGLLAIQGKARDDQVHVLASLGFSNSEISNLTGIPKGTVDVVRARKKKGQGLQKTQNTNQGG